MYSGFNKLALTLKEKSMEDGTNGTPIYYRDLTPMAQSMVNVSSAMIDKAEEEGLDIIVGYWITDATLED